MGEYLLFTERFPSYRLIKIHIQSKRKAPAYKPNRFREQFEPLHRALLGTDRAISSHNGACQPEGLSYNESPGCSITDPVKDCS